MELEFIKPGDLVMDDTGQFARVHRVCGYSKNAEGIVTEWRVAIRYEWDMPGYGKERTVDHEEITKILGDGMHVIFRQDGTILQQWKEPTWHRRQNY